MVRFATGPTGSVDSSWFSVISVVCTVGIAISDEFVAVAVRICLTTVFITVKVVTGAIFVGVILVSLFLELTTLISAVAGLFAVMTGQFGFLMVSFCGFLRHSVDLHFVRSFQTIQL